MKKILIAICLLTGCAALRGQTKYTGTGTAPTITERIVHSVTFQRPRLGMMTEEQKKEALKKALGDYWSSPVDKMATASNPLNDSVKVWIKCYASFPSEFDFVIPPHTSQDMLFTTNAEHMYETLCSIVDYEITADLQISGIKK